MSAVLVLVLVLAVSPATPQTRKPGMFGTEVTTVAVPALVTDKDNQPVTGLTFEDFEITDDGRPVTITAFEETDAGTPGAPAGDAMANRRQFLLLFDLSFTNVPGLMYARRVATEFTKSMLPNDLAAVATFSAKTGNRILLGFTSDRAQIATAVERLGLEESERKADPLMLVYDMGARSRQESTGDSAREDRMQEELMTQQLLATRLEAQVYQQHVRGLLVSFLQLARALDAVQGRKHVLYFSAGFDDSVLVGANGSQASANAERGTETRAVDTNRPGNAGLHGDLDQVLRTLSAADVVVHTVDVTESGSDPTSGRESLNRIAGGTGGRAVTDANDVGQALADILDHTRHYYVMAFEPAQTKGAGKYHRLRVRVRGKDREVDARPGYIEKDPTVQSTALAANLQAGEAIVKGVTGGEIALSAVAVPYRDPTGRISLPVAVEVDGQTLLTRDPTKGLSIQIVGYVMDQQGRIEDNVSVAANVDVSKLGARIHQGGLQLQTVFAVPPGRHSLRFLVRDLETGRRGVRALDVEVPEFKQGEVVVAPLFTEDADQWVVLRNPSRNGAGMEIPFRVEGAPFALRGRPRLSNGETNKICVLLYDGGKDSAEAAPFEIKAQLWNAEGKQVRLGRMEMVKTVTETGGYRRFVLGITPSSVLAGDYDFKIKVRDLTTGNVLETAERVTVR